MKLHEIADGDAHAYRFDCDFSSVHESGNSLGVISEIAGGKASFFHRNFQGKVYHRMRENRREEAG